MKRKSNKMNGVVIDESVYNTTTDSDIKELLDKVDKLTTIMDNKMDKLIERLDKILIANGIY